MYDLRLPFGAGPEAEFAEHFQHRGVLGQHLRDQLFQACVTRQSSQMTHEHRPDTLALIRIDHHESYLGLPRPDNDISSTAGDSRASVFIDLRDERDMVFEVDVHEEGYLLLREALFWREKAPLKRLRACAPYRREHLGPVVGTKCPDFDRATVAKMLDDRIIGGSRHEKWFPVSGMVPSRERMIFPCSRLIWIKRELARTSRLGM